MIYDGLMVMVLDKHFSIGVMRMRGPASTFDVPASQTL